MDLKNTIRLIALSAIWGGSFIFMRMIAPVLGPILTASMRTFIAGIFLILIFKATHYKIQWKRDWKVFLTVGVVNSSIPFFMFAYAAQYIPASLSAIINSMTPMFGAVFSALFLIETMNFKKIAGLLLGVIGVSMVSSLTVINGETEVILSILACLCATLCYGISGVIIKLRAAHIESKAMTAGSQLFAGLALLPLSLKYPVQGTIDGKMVVLILLFAVICNAFAYLLFYKLIHEVGPTKALTVTFVIPVFGIVWGYLLLGESISAMTLIGGSVILLGTYLVTTSQNKMKHNAEKVA